MKNKTLSDNLTLALLQSNSKNASDDEKDKKLKSKYQSITKHLSQEVLRRATSYLFYYLTYSLLILSL